MDNIEKAKKIISDILYITIASVSKDGVPWNSPVYSAFDEQYNFYWVSPVTATHSENVKGNPQVSIVIYDSTVPEGTGEGVYIQAKAHEINDEKEIEHALPYLYNRKNKPVRPIASFTGGSPRRVYKAVPGKVWVNDTVEVNGQPCDVRVEVKLI
jgi:nitroimidazol reductase NimA-like FMN-containing flavoprotein (pyridoxamine 5'-phosphate oxidase superfamily)